MSRPGFETSRLVSDGLGFARPPVLGHRDRFTIEGPLIHHWKVRGTRLEMRASWSPRPCLKFNLLRFNQLTNTWQVKRKPVRRMPARMLKPGCIPDYLSKKTLYRFKQQNCRCARCGKYRPVLTFPTFSACYKYPLNQYTVRIINRCDE